VQQWLWDFLVAIIAIIGVLITFNMFMKTTALIISSTAFSFYPAPDQEFYFEGDYTEVAREYYPDTKPETFDPNDILYQAILKEILDGKHNLK